MIADLLRLAWIVIVAAVLLYAFGRGRRGVRRDPAARIALFARAIVVVILAVNLFSRLHIFNAATILLACVVWPAARWLKRYEWKPERALRSGVRSVVLDLVRRAEQPVATWTVVRWTARVRRRARALSRVAVARMNRMSATDVALAAAAAACVAAALYIRLGTVLGESRLGNPALYGALLAARQALFNAPDGFVPALSALSAALGTAASLHTIHVLRLLGPVFGIAIVVTSGALVFRVTHRRSAAIVALAIAAALTPAWSSGDIEIAIAFLLLGSLSLSYRTPASHHGFAASVMAAALALPGATAAGIALLLQTAAAVAAGCAFAWFVTLARRRMRLHAEPLAAPAACLALVLLLPESPRGLFLEYPAAQAQALEIASTMPRGRWLIVAPVEQLAESYGRGWFEEQAAFLERYAARAGEPRFTFDLAVDDVLVFVEKRPFKTFARETSGIRFATLSDPTYRNYRSLAGRASLQARLQALCEAYARTHEGASVYYADDDLIIYRFRLRG